MSPLIVALDKGLSRIKIIYITDENVCLEEYPSRNIDVVYNRVKNASRIIAVENVPMDFLSRFHNAEITRVPELNATSLGALVLAGIRKGIVASMGTGTAFLVASMDRNPKHVIGTGVGGGLLEGFSRYLGCKNITEFLDLASRGNPWNVDLKVGHIYPNGLPSLPPGTTASNMALLSKETAAEDIAAGVVRLVGETIGVIASLLIREYKVPLILVGGVSRIGDVIKNIASAIKLFCRNGEVIVPSASSMATALGALLFATEKDKWKSITEMVRSASLITH